MNAIRIDPSEITCEFSHCTRPACYRVRFGKTNERHMRVCEWHCEAMWVQVETQVKAGEGFWTQEPAYTEEGAA